VLAGFFIALLVLLMEKVWANVKSGGAKWRGLSRRYKKLHADVLDKLSVGLYLQMRN
jgi:hypothetical protein